MMNKLYEMFESWYINYIKHMNINIPDRYIDIDEVYETHDKKKMNRCNKPDLEYPDVPDLYYRSVVEKMNKIKDKPITIDDLMKVDLSMIGMFEDYVIPKSKSDDKPNDVLGILK